MRVLLTGAGGFVGSHTLIHLLHNTDWEIVCTDSFRHMGKTDRIVEVMHEHLDYADRIKVVTHDLTVPFSDQLIDQIGPIDYIISMASESHVDRSITFPVDFVQNNVNLILNLLEYARIVKPKKFIQVSTDEVYGPAPAGHNHREWETLLPSNPYSASKAAQEAICFSYWRTYGVPVIITNTMNIIGELQDPEKFVPMTIKKVLAGEPMTIHASAAGKIGSRFYLHARNQADALLFILQNIDIVTFGQEQYDNGGEGESPEITRIDRPKKFHIVGEREVDNLEMAQLIAKFAGKDLKYELIDFHSSRPGHDLRYALDGNLLAAYGWKAPVSFEESLKKTVEWSIEHKEWLQ